jgi:glycosyltransferase involved in cell wall biosynthesis
MSPSISVIIPTYNRAHIVPEAIDSVLAQTYGDFEIIVIDDGSTDVTATVLQRRYGEKITCIRIKNSGLPAARNAGIKAARGQYIAFLDDDDEWLPEKLTLQMQLLQNNSGVGLVYCGCLQIDAEGTVLNQLYPEKRGTVFNDLLEENYIIGSASAVLVRKELVERAGCFDETLKACEDWDLWIRISRLCLIDYINKPLVRYTLHQGNMHKDIENMEQNTRAMLNKYLPAVGETARKERLHKHNISFAWQYYHAGNMQQFRRLLFQALELSPLADDLFSYSGNIPEKEHTFFAALDAYWARSDDAVRRALGKDSRSRQHLQLAWFYYQQGDMHNFRRHMLRAIGDSFPRNAGRMLIPFLKSFFGKKVSERLHTLRAKFFKA